MTVMAAPPRSDDYGSRAVVLDWHREYLPWLQGKLTHKRVGAEHIPLPRAWRPGEHWACCGPTGEGKSTHVVGVLGVRKWVLALDPKGADETLEASGYLRMREIPPPKGFPFFKPKPGTERWIWDRIDNDLPVGLIAGFESLTDEDDLELHALLHDAITWVRRTRGWTLYVDEHEVLSSQRMFREGPAIERMLITARRAGTSVVTSFQAPAWVSKHATRQASFVSVWKTKDVDMVQAIARAAGRDWHLIGAAIDELPEFHSLTIPVRQLRAPMLITKAPKIS